MRTKLHRNSSRNGTICTPHALYIKVKTRAGSLLGLIIWSYLFLSTLLYIFWRFVEDSQWRISCSCTTLLIFLHCPENSLIILGTVKVWLTWACLWETLFLYITLVRSGLTKMTCLSCVSEYCISKLQVWSKSGA